MIGDWRPSGRLSNAVHELATGSYSKTLLTVVLPTVNPPATTMRPSSVIACLHVAEHDRNVAPPRDHVSVAVVDVDLRLVAGLFILEVLTSHDVNSVPIAMPARWPRVGRGGAAADFQPSFLDRS